MARTGKHILNQSINTAIWAMFGLFLFVNPAFATPVQVDDIAATVATSTGQLPGLIAAFSYLLATLFGAWGVLKLKEHVENPSQTPIRTPVIRLLAGGALFALPNVLNAMFGLFGNAAGVDAQATLEDGAGIRGILVDMAGSIETLPQLLSSISYLLGLILGVSAVLKVKAHIENPDQTPLKDSVIRFAVGGALFALPALYGAMQGLVGSGGTIGIETEIEGDGITSLMTNISKDFSQIQFFIVYVMGYLTALLFGVLGILKLKDHVDNPSQVSIKVPLVRFLAAGLFFAMPTVVSAVEHMINGGDITEFDPTDGFSMVDVVSSVGGVFGGGLNLGGVQIGTPDLNGIMANIENGLIGGAEAFVTAVAYLLAIIAAFAGVLKLKEHVENPDQVTISQPITRFVTAGALFAIPTIFQAVADMVTGGEGIGAIGNITQGVMIANWTTSKYAAGNILESTVDQNIAGSLGGAIKGTLVKAIYAPAFLHALAYLFGLILAVWGVMKMRDHVLNPSQTNVWEGATRLLAAGLFFAMPVTVEAVRSSIAPDSGSVLNTIGTVMGAEYNEELSGCGGFSLGAIAGAAANAVGGLINGGANGGGLTSSGTAPGLGSMLGCMMNDILGPIHSLLSFFGYVAGTIFIMIGVSRLTKSAQDGARGPGGLGTFMTFIAGGALISFNDLVSSVSFSLLGQTGTQTYSTLTYDAGMSTSELQHAHTVISAILKFMIVIGLISFVRGIFIIRNVAEGNGQASMMSGVTHLVAGAIAVNLGAFIERVQGSLGIADFGLKFSVMG